MFIFSTKAKRKSFKNPSNQHFLMVDKDTPIEDLLDIEPAAEVLMMHGLVCGGCEGCGANFGTIADVAERHGLDVNKLISEINQAIDEAEEEDED